MRVSELVALTWAQIDFRDGVIHVRRSKNGRDSTQPLRGAEMRVLKQLRREWPEGQFILQSERGGPISAAGFRVMLARTGKAAGFAWLVHPHQLRHATGYALANKGVDTRTLQHYLGTARSRTRCATPNSPPIASPGCGRTAEPRRHTMQEYEVDFAVWADEQAQDENKTRGRVTKAPRRHLGLDLIDAVFSAIYGISAVNGGSQ